MQQELQEELKKYTRPSSGPRGPHIVQMGKQIAKKQTKKQANFQEMARVAQKQKQKQCRLGEMLGAGQKTQGLSDADAGILLLDIQPL